jgi:hypothetical protein
VRRTNDLVFVGSREHVEPLKCFKAGWWQNEPLKRRTLA